MIQRAIVDAAGIMVMLCSTNLCYCFNGKRSEGMGMLQSWNSKHTSAATTIAATMAVLLTSYFGLAGAVQATEVRHPHTQHDTGDGYIPTGKGWGKFDPSGMAFARANKSSRTSTNGILYYGGPLIVHPVNVYYIWYGGWDFNSVTDPTDKTTQTLLNTFGSSIGGTPYFNINTTYYDFNKKYVTGAVALPNSTVDSGGPSTLSDADVQAIVANALANGALPTDPDGVYFVLTSKEVKESSGFCTQYCAWHTHGTINGEDIKYGFIGNPESQCPLNCAVQINTPNSNYAADTMANLIAHELAESTTDPDLNAWFDRRGYENADKCAWKFGTTSQDSTNGPIYNVSFGGKKWLLQQNWINAGGGYCTLANP
jgi:hypothetical protein